MSDVARDIATIEDARRDELKNLFSVCFRATAGGSTTQISEALDRFANGVQKLNAVRDFAVKRLSGARDG